MPQENAHHFEPKNITTQDMYKLMTGSVVPRPIAWVSSQHEDGTRNIAPFSFFTVASSNRLRCLFQLVQELKIAKAP